MLLSLEVWRKKEPQPEEEEPKAEAKDKPSVSAGQHEEPPA